MCELTRQEIRKVLMRPAYMYGVIKWIEDQISDCNARSFATGCGIAPDGIRIASGKGWTDWIAEKADLQDRHRAAIAEYHQARQECEDLLEPLRYRKPNYHKILNLHYSYRLTPQDVISESGLSKTTVYRVLQEAENVIQKYT